MQSLSLKSKKILGISVTMDSKQTILEYIEKYLENSSEKLHKPLTIVTPNPEQIVAARRDPHFAKLLNKADVALPDGIGLIFAAKISDFSHSPITHHPSLVKIPGVELMEDLIQLASERGYRIGLIGGRAGVAIRALECLSRRRAGLKGWAIEPEEKTIEEITRKIVDSHTRLVFVGLGAPKQEEFIARLASQDTLLRTQESVLLMSVGGSFDMISGKTPRAPHAMQTVHLEWLWRLIVEPWRWQRQMALVKFLWLVVREKLASKGLTL